MSGLRCFCCLLVLVVLAVDVFVDFVSFALAADDNEEEEADFWLMMVVGDDCVVDVVSVLLTVLVAKFTGCRMGVL